MTNENKVMKKAQETLWAFVKSVEDNASEKEVLSFFLKAWNAYSYARRICGNTKEVIRIKNVILNNRDFYLGF